MAKRRRLTGKERREERRRARQTAPWLGSPVVLATAAAAALVSVTVALVVLVFNGDDGATGQATTRVTPTPRATVAADTGPPPTSLEPTVTETGLQIIDLAPGDGETAEAGKAVTVHYSGWLSDGTRFGTSLGGSPFTLTLGTGDVIAGWDEGLVGMKAGGERRLIIPSDLAYGPSGSPPKIPPNAELTFDVQLLSVEDPVAPDATPAP